MDSKAFKLLLEAGADPNARGKEVRPSVQQNARYLAPGPIADYLSDWPKNNLLKKIPAARPGFPLS